MTELALLEHKRLDELEAIIERGLQTFVEVGEALMEIRDSRLYKRTHSAFGDYCRERWGFSRGRGYQLIDAAKFTKELSTDCGQLEPADRPRDKRRGWVEGAPENEHQARVLRAAERRGSAAERCQVGTCEGARPAESQNGFETLKVSENDFQKAVTEALTAFGWRWIHFRPARTMRGWTTALSGSPGFPDLVAVRGERILYVELKAQKGTLRDEQRDWLADLGAAGAEVHCWRPSDWPLIEGLIR